VSSKGEGETSSLTQLFHPDAERGLNDPLQASERTTCPVPSLRCTCFCARSDGRRWVRAARTAGVPNRRRRAYPAANRGSRLA